MAECGEMSKCLTKGTKAQLRARIKELESAVELGFKNFKIVVEERNKARSINDSLRAEIGQVRYDWGLSLVAPNDGVAQSELGHRVKTLTKQLSASEALAERRAAEIADVRTAWQADRDKAKVVEKNLESARNDSARLSMECIQLRAERKFIVHTAMLPDIVNVSHASDIDRVNFRPIAFVPESKLLESESRLVDVNKQLGKYCSDLTQLRNSLAAFAATVCGLTRSETEWLRSQPIALSDWVSCGCVAGDFLHGAWAATYAGFRPSPAQPKATAQVTELERKLNIERIARDAWKERSQEEQKARIAAEAELAKIRETARVMETFDSVIRDRDQLRINLGCEQRARKAVETQLAHANLVKDESLKTLGEITPQGSQVNNIRQGPSNAIAAVLVTRPGWKFMGRVYGFNHGIPDTNSMCLLVDKTSK